MKRVPKIQTILSALVVALLLSINICGLTSCIINPDEPTDDPSTSGGGTSGGTTTWSCSSGYCLARLGVTSFKCCPSNYPYYGCGKCYKSTSDALREHCNTTYKCSKYF